MGLVRSLGKSWHFASFAMISYIFNILTFRSETSKWQHVYVVVFTLIYWLNQLADTSLGSVKSLGIGHNYDISLRLHEYTETPAGAIMPTTLLTDHNINTLYFEFCTPSL